MPAPRIAIVGSYATGLVMKVAKIPVRGETVLGSGYRVDFGGKGSNQAVGCARLGAETSFIAKLGQDNFAKMALDLYRAEGIDTSYIRRTNRAPTGVGFIMVEADSGHNSIVLDPGANDLLEAEEVTASTSAMENAAVVMTQLEIPVEAAEAAMALGRKSGAITVLNPAPVRLLPPSVFQNTDVLTPNETEAKVLVGLAPDAAVQPEQLATELVKQGAKQVVITLGERGALVVTASSSTLIPAFRMQVVDTTGAGDAFNAGLATALSAGIALESAVRFAVIVAGLAVTKEGVIPALPRRADVMGFYRQNQLSPPDFLRA